MAIRNIRRALTTPEKVAQHKLPGGAYVKTQSGTFVPKAEANRVRKYGAWSYEGDDPYMLAAYEAFIKRPFWKKTTKTRGKKQSQSGPHCAVAQWVLMHRGADVDHCIIVPDIVPGRVQKVKYNFKTMNAPRAALIGSQGLPPSNAPMVTHKCGNGHLSCVNPRHLAWGDAKQNAHDRVLHDESTPAVEVEPDVAEAIKTKPGMVQVIAWQFRVPVATVRALRESA